MADYQPFPITSSKTGIFNYLESWIRPEDAYDPLINATVYRGVLSKRNGYIQLGNQLDDMNPVMGIMTWQDESTGKESLIVTSTQNAYLYDAGSNTFNLITSIKASNFWQGIIPGGKTITVPTFWPNLTPTTISITDGTDTITDDGAGNLSAAGNFAAGGTINYTTGSVTINFSAVLSTVVSLSITATTTGTYFTGKINNFFNWTNWQPTDPRTSVETTSFLYMTNDVDPVTLFDGTNLSRPIYYIDNTLVNTIETTFDVKVFQNRLLFILPTISSATNPLNQTIFWSAQYNPTDFINNIAGHGGQLAAATGDVLQSFNFLRDSCVVRFSKSIWLFRYTGNDFDPFRFFKINVTKRTSCPYASVSYDERETGIGSTGIIACDGVNAQRFDINIIDFYETEMSEKYFAQAFSQRYDNDSETWTLYVSQSNENPFVGGVAPGSDKALIYNFVEQSWATHEFTDPLTCMGMFNVVTGTTWADLPQPWEETNNVWFVYSNQANAPELLAGDTTGNVWWMDNQNATTDNGEIITATITTKRWNPFVNNGQKTQFGYIDFYYSVEANCTIDLTFFVDNSGSPNDTRTLTLDADGTDGRAGSDFAMKRIYVNLTGEFIQMEMVSSSKATFQILGMILWARPAGRLTP